MAKAAAKEGKTDRDPVLVDLALQGGGSHGAFTWGVLDRLLEEPWLKIEAISGTSAGAMNARRAGQRLHAGRRGGRAGGARRLLGAGRGGGAIQPDPALAARPADEPLERSTRLPAYLAMDLMSRVVSPYSLNPFGINPISDDPRRRASISPISARRSIKLFITATNVHTGRGRVFRNKEITPDVLLASACLPTMFQAIEIDGEPYWDGGYVGNPTITPLVRESDALDVILVQINPRERRETPRTASEILNRLNEISFNSPLMKELRMIALLRQAADPGTGEGARWARMRTHRIVTDKLAEFGASSKLNAEGEFLAHAQGGGPAQRRRVPGEHGDDLGKALDGRPRRSAGGVLSDELLRSRSACSESWSASAS